MWWIRHTEAYYAYVVGHCAPPLYGVSTTSLACQRNCYDPLRPIRSLEMIMEYAGVSVFFSKVNKKALGRCQKPPSFQSMRCNRVKPSMINRLKSVPRSEMFMTQQVVFLLITTVMLLFSLANLPDLDAGPKALSWHVKSSISESIKHELLVQRACRFQNLYHANIPRDNAEFTNMVCAERNGATTFLRMHRTGSTLFLKANVNGTVTFYEVKIKFEIENG